MLRSNGCVLYLQFEGKGTCHFESVGNMGEDAAYRSAFANQSNSVCLCGLGKQLCRYNGGSYTVTDTEIAADQIGKRIGQVTHYSEKEGTYRGDFSNTFAKGSPYYAIQRVSVQE